MKINGVETALAVEEAKILALFESYTLNIDPKVPKAKIAPYVEEQQKLLSKKYEEITGQINALYEDKLNALKEERQDIQNQVSRCREVVDNLAAEIGVRKAFCSTMTERLSTLKAVINKEQPFSALPVSKDQLLECFELSPAELSAYSEGQSRNRVVQLINALYDQKQAEQKRFGLNATNIQNKATSIYRWMKNIPTQATPEEKELMGLIDKRLAQIERELKVGEPSKPDIEPSKPDIEPSKPTSTKSSRRANRRRKDVVPQNLAADDAAPQYFPDNNLYRLTKDLRGSQQKLQETEALLTQKDSIIDEVEKENKAVLDVATKELDARKSQHEQTLLCTQWQIVLADNTSALKTLTHNCDAFQKKLTTINEMVKAVNRTFEAPHNLNIDALAQLIADKGPLFLALDEHLKKSNSIHQIGQDIDPLIKHIKNELADLQKIANKINPMPEELTKQQKLLESQLSELESQYSLLSPRLQPALDRLAHSKKELDPFVTLVQIKNKYAGFIQQIGSDMTAQQRKELVDAIKKTRKEKIALLSLVRSGEYKGKLTVQQIKTGLEAEERELSHFLGLDKLNQIQEIYTQLIEKSKLIASKEPKEPNEVMKLVHDIEELEKQSRFVHTPSPTKPVVVQQAKRAIINLKTTLNASLHGQYEQIARITTEHYDAKLLAEQKRIEEEVTVTKKILDTFRTDADARRAFLSKAQTGLATLKTSLASNEGILKTTRKEALTYFEAAPKDRAPVLLNELYDQEEAKVNQFGLNFTFVKYTWNVSGSVYTAETTVAAKAELILLIDKRLAQIQEELAIDDITATVDCSLMPKHLAENNLYALSMCYQETQDGYVKEQRILNQKRKDLEKISQKKVEILALFESMKTTHDAQILLNKLAEGQEKIEQQRFVFAQKVATMEQTYRELDGVIELRAALKVKIGTQKTALVASSEEMNRSLEAHSQLFKDLDTLLPKIPHHSMMEQRALLLSQFNAVKEEKVRLSNDFREKMLTAEMTMRQLEESLASRNQPPKKKPESSEPAPHNPLLGLSNFYFGTEEERRQAVAGLAGMFGAYLIERAQTFWFNDLLSSIAAFALGCFGYKTGAQLRQEYLTNELQPAFISYQNEPTDAHRETLLSIIADGKTQFPSRTAHNAAEENNSLRAKLNRLEADVRRNSSREELRVEEPAARALPLRLM